MRCTCRCGVPPVPLEHFRSTRFKISPEELINLVPFFTGASPCSSVDVIPKAHMWSTTQPTSAWAMSSVISGMSQAFDFSGCSCTKCRRPWSCSRYTSMQNLSWFLPFLSSASITFGSRFARLISCREENAVHCGDPMTRTGLTSLIS